MRGECDRQQPARHKIFLYVSKLATRLKTALYKDIWRINATADIRRMNLSDTKTGWISVLVLNKQGLIDAMVDGGFTQAKLSRQTGISKRLISEMINRERYFIRVKTISRLRRALDCSLYSLIKGDINRNET